MRIVEKCIGAQRCRRVQRALRQSKVTILCLVLTVVVLRGTIGAGKFGTPEQDFIEELPTTKPPPENLNNRYMFSYNLEFTVAKHLVAVSNGNLLYQNKMVVGLIVGRSFMAYIIRNLEVDFVLLAGYLQFILLELKQAYPRSTVNIHPSLLPAFAGKGNYEMRVHQAVISFGARYSGLTIHFLDEHYDIGRILAQRVVPVLANDTAEELAARVLREEHQLYVEVIATLCEGRLMFAAVSTLFAANVSFSYAGFFTWIGKIQDLNEGGPRQRAEALTELSYV